MRFVRIDILEDLCIKKHIGLIQWPSHIKTFHARLVLKAVVAVLIDECLNLLEIAFHNRCNVNDVPHLRAECNKFFATIYFRPKFQRTESNKF